MKTRAIAFFSMKDKGGKDVERSRSMNGELAKGADNEEPSGIDSCEGSGVKEVGGQEERNVVRNDEERTMCPICGEEMINLVQLNQHVDDVHLQAEESDKGMEGAEEQRNEHQDGSVLSTGGNKNNNVQSEVNTKKGSLKIGSKDRNLKVDLLENSMGFTLSDNNSSSDHIAQKKDENHTEASNSTLTRRHWISPYSTSTCSHPQCRKSLGVKNGVVNCRKCGRLFCNEHTYFKVRLRNSETRNGVEYDCSKFGGWHRCCQECYFKKPDLVLGTQSGMKNITNDFTKMRQKKSDAKNFERGKIQKRFIRLVDLHAINYLKLKNQPLFGFAISPFTSHENIIEKEKQIVGLNSWQLDSCVTNCPICFSRFNLFLRKHHCRLCGRIVCSENLNKEKQCSMLVPFGVFLDKLNNLNYTPIVKKKFSSLKQVNDENFAFRCCTDCKNYLLHSWRTLNQPSMSPEEREIFSFLDKLILVRERIDFLLSLHERHNNEEKEKETIRIREKVMSSSKLYENLIVQFANKFFMKENRKLIVAPFYTKFAIMINNIYFAYTNSFQDLLLRINELNQISKDQEINRLSEANAVSEHKAPHNIEVIPKLTKKEIRKLRETLMVMHEQKFLVENHIKEVTSHRKFDELTSLLQNRTELEVAIMELEEKLGSFGFGK